VLEVESVLGVEAARTQISAEIENIMNAYGAFVTFLWFATETKL
jgi:hypothetical protein